VKGKKEEEELIEQAQKTKMKQIEKQKKQKEIEILLDPQNIFKEIPKEKDELFNYSIKWDIVDKVC
jgi:hypothetical protein